MPFIHPSDRVHLRQERIGDQDDLSDRGDMSTATETAVITALQSIFEALNAIASELPPATREKVQAHAARIAQAKATIKAEVF